MPHPTRSAIATGTNMTDAPGNTSNTGQVRLHQDTPRYGWLPIPHAAANRPCERSRTRSPPPPLGCSWFQVVAGGSHDQPEPRSTARLDGKQLGTPGGHICEVTA